MDPKTYYMCWIKDSLNKKGSKNKLFISIDFFRVFVGYGLRILGYFQNSVKKIKMYLKCHLNASKDTLQVLDRRLFKKKGSKNNLFISIDFFIVFVGYGLRILGYFSKLGKKNKKSLSCRLNVCKDTLYVLDRRFFKKKDRKTTYSFQ